MVNNPLTKLLFIAPKSNLSGNSELARIASGNTLEIVDGLLDRAGLERALRDPADVVHFVSHGAEGILTLADETIDAADLVAMLQPQRKAKLFFLNACDSLSTATAIHNAFHIPVIAHEAEIGDKAAVHFATVFYRKFRTTQDVGASFAAAQQSLLRQYPTQAAIPQLINGDMATQTDIADCMAYLKSELGGVFEHFNERLDKQDAAILELGRNVKQIERRQAESHNKTAVIVIALVAALVILQAATPFLNGLLVR